VSGREEVEEDAPVAYSSKYFISLVSISSVRRLNVASTTGRSWMRKDHIRILPDFITPQRGDGVDSKKDAADHPTGLVNHRMHEGELTRRRTLRTEERRRMKKTE
jgi:hypothetical protein